MTQDPVCLVDSPPVVHTDPNRTYSAQDNLDDVVSQSGRR